MTDRLKVKWLFGARIDLFQIGQYIANDSPTNAKKSLRTFKEAVIGLEEFPNRGRVVPELEKQGVFLYREIVISPWRIVYRFSGKTIVIFAVIDSRMNVDDILFNRLYRDESAIQNQAFD